MRVRLKAPDEVLPGTGRTRREILNAFRAYQVQYIDRLRQANGVDLARARVRMPVNGWLRIPLGSGFELMVGALPSSSRAGEAGHGRREFSRTTRLRRARRSMTMSPLFLEMAAYRYCPSGDHDT